MVSALAGYGSMEVAGRGLQGERRRRGPSATTNPSRAVVVLLFTTAAVVMVLLGALAATTFYSAGGGKGLVRSNGAPSAAGPSPMEQVCCRGSDHGAWE